MEFDYKAHLLLQAIFPQVVITYIIKENFLGIKPLLRIIEEVLSQN